MITDNKVGDITSRGVHRRGSDLIIGTTKLEEREESSSEDGHGISNRRLGKISVRIWLEMEECMDFVLSSGRDME